MPAVAIENRWYLGYFLGESPHGEPPFLSVLPRLLARVLNRVIRKRDYRTYIYSYFGYKRPLPGVGFKNINISIAYPNYYSLEQILPVSSETEKTIFDMKRDLLLGKRAAIEKLLFFIGIYRFFESAFFISATKG